MNSFEFLGTGLVAAGATLWSEATPSGLGGPACDRSPLLRCEFERPRGSALYAPEMSKSSRMRVLLGYRFACSDAPALRIPEPGERFEFRRKGPSGRHA